MFLPKLHVRAFEEELWRDYPEALERRRALHERDPDLFLREAERAWEIRDTKALVAFAEALIARDAPEPEIGLRAGIALLLHDRPADALAMLSRPEVAGIRHPKAAYHQGRALAGCGRFVEALGAAEASLTLRPSFADAITLMRRLAATLHLELQTAETLDWARAHQLMNHYAALGARGPAAALYERALKLEPVQDPLLFNDMFFVIEAGFGLGADRAAIVAFLGAALALDPDNGYLHALKAECEVLQGRPAEASAAPRSGPDAENKEWRFCQALAHEATGELEAACDQLGALTVDYGEDQTLRHALAHVIGAHVASTVRPKLARRKRRKVFDLFPFSDELTLLRLRLNEMADWVDHFVIVEAAQTFTGAPKPLTFQEHQEEFADFRSKIIHLPIQAFPDHVNTPWAREFFQRDSAIAAIADMWSEDDLVFSSDVDEIVDGRAVEGFDGDFARLHMNLFRFFLNYRPMDWSEFRTGRTGAIFKARHLKDRGLSYARVVLSRHKKDWCRILDAGWHFNSVGQAEKIARKYNNYAHASGDAAYRDTTALEQLLSRIRAGQPEDEWERCEIDETFPRYVRENREALAELIL